MKVDALAGAIGAGAGAIRQILADTGSGHTGVRDAGIIRPALSAVVNGNVLTSLRRFRADGSGAGIFRFLADDWCTCGTASCPVALVAARAEDSIVTRSSSRFRQRDTIALLANALT